ncbi:MAG: hypothetical protein ABS888_10080, partial [Eubacteriales bacterium]
MAIQPAVGLSNKIHIIYVKVAVAQWNFRGYNKISVLYHIQAAYEGVDGMIIVEILLTVFLSASSVLTMVFSVLYLIGLWKLFEKS